MRLVSARPLDGRNAVEEFVLINNGLMSTSKRRKQKAWSAVAVMLSSEWGVCSYERNRNDW